MVSLLIFTIDSSLVPSFTTTTISSGRSTPAAGMVVRELPNDTAFSQFMADAAMKLVVIDFYADWCGPCRMISPQVERLSEKYLQAVFMKVNVDTCRQTSVQFGISAMPTFVLLKNGNEVDRMMGANAEMLEAKIVQHLSQNTAATSEAIAATPNERAFLEKFLNYSQRMQMYEDDIAQTLARSLIPYDRIMEESKRNGKTNEFELVKFLLNWFKTEFFTWVDTPKCELCGQKTKVSDEIEGTPTEEERKSGADRVEVYKCQNCQTDVRFLRYDDPTKLLETRCGRCGEWANCFTLCCRAMGIETRFVYDVTDHVWCEVWINDLDRWVHCDPCENVIDTPLLYEKGWGKKLSYVMAFGLDHVRDVSWRYTFNHLETLTRRLSCREAVLRNFIRKLNFRHESLMPDERKKEMERRYMKELVEFISPNVQLREGSKVQEQGRTTGSEEWKKQRGEAGDGKSAATVLVPTEKEISDKVFSLEYDCAKDQYRRGGDVIKGWESLVNKQENICRVVDLTNNVAYLCREQGKPDGELCWSFDFGDHHVKNIEFRLDGIKKEDEGVVRAIICCGDTCTMVPPSGELEMETIEGSKMDVKIYFSGGEAQLFRASLQADSFCFCVKAYFS